MYHHSEHTYWFIEYCFVLWMKIWTSYDSTHFNICYDYHLQLYCPYTCCNMSTSVSWIKQPLNLHLRKCFPFLWNRCCSFFPVYLSFFHYFWWVCWLGITYILVVFKLSLEDMLEVRVEWSIALICCFH